ncbi:MAG TPA: PA14 domain-containing protein [Pirellulales bacterium]|nr:PA14 domain-containing protein [Pirellulales bacterium]
MKIGVHVWIVAAASLVASGNGAFATTIDADAYYAGSIPVASGTGLNGLYYGQPATAGNVADDTYVASNSPVATFLSTGIDYPTGVTGSSYADTNTLANFLSPDAGSLSVPSAGSNTLGNQLITFTGYIALQAGTTTLQLGVDDGGYVNIGGVGFGSPGTIIDNDGDHAYAIVQGSVTVTNAGLYPIYIDYHEDGGNTGLSFQYGTGDVVPASVLYPSAPVPEPASMILLGIGGLSMLWFGRGRRWINPRCFRAS